MENKKIIIIVVSIFVLAVGALAVGALIILNIAKFELSLGEKPTLPDGDYTNKQQSSNNSTESGPPKNLVESEITYIINRIPAEDYKYNASIFLGQDGVFKDLNVTNTEILSRSAIQNVEGIAQQTIQVRITGIMDRYAVNSGLNGTRPGALIPQGRGNFIVEKEFVFKKNNIKWIGYINDNARDRVSLRFKKKLMR